MFSARSRVHHGSWISFASVSSAALLRPSSILQAAVESPDRLQERVPDSSERPPGTGDVRTDALDVAFL